ncbi:hypothetical protein Focb16_v006855 [Fusarium oxysporum f. sp. cubense]|uniref:Uncharacterized protein n=1 Tax=Fusarium oxysporum f. sp. cubense TaxID=61366 RepID=A0A559LRT2_FUSOC|nr:hypothetical protein Focb16_v006855 [Fusarium oxysporum f. sp. cubense]
MPRQTITQSSWYDNARRLKDPKPRLEWDEVTEWEEANLCNKITIFDLPLECPFPLTNRRNACALIENFLDAVRYHRELFPYWRRRAIKYFIWREWFVIRNNDEWKDYRNHPLFKNRDALRALAKKQFQNVMGLASGLLFVLHGLYTNDWELEFLLKGQQKLIDTYNMCDVNMTLWNREKMLDILFIECQWLKDTLLEAHMKEKKEIDEEWEHRQTKTLEEMEVFIDETPELMDEDEDDDNAQGNAQNNAQNNAQGITQGITQNNTQNNTRGIDQGNAQDIDPWDVPITMCMNQWDDQSFAQQFEQMLRRQEKDLRQWDAQCYAQGLNESLVHSMAQILKFEVEDAQYFAQRRAQDVNQRKARSIAQERAQQHRNRRQARIRAQIRAERRAHGRTQGRTQDKARGIAQNNTQRIVQYFDRDTSQNIIQSLPRGNTKKSVKAFMEGVYQELARGIAQDKAQQRRTQRRAHRTVQENIRETTQNTAKENGQEGTQNNLQDSTATAHHHQRTDSQTPEEPVNTAVPPIDPRPALPARPVDDDEDIYGYSGGEDGNTKKK